MWKDNMLLFKGMLCIDIPMNNGISISLLKWDSTPTKYNAFAQVWLTSKEGRKSCYIDPGEAEELLNIYHRFDEVVPAKLLWNWKSKDELEVIIENRNIRICLRAVPSIFGVLINALLKTPFRGLFNKTGITETGKSYCHQPRRIRVVKSAIIDFGQSNTEGLRENAKTVVSWGTHYIEEPK